MSAGSGAAHARATLLAAMSGPTAGETIGHLSNGAQALLGLVERLSQTLDPNIAEQISHQCEGMRRTAHRARLTLLAESSGARTDDH